MRDVKISRVMNGFVVKVGCQTLVFENQNTLIKELNTFLANPELVEKEYIVKYGVQGGEDTRC